MSAPKSLRSGELQRDVVGIAELQNVHRPDVLDRLADDAECVQMIGCRVLFGLAVQAERQVIKAGAILVEPV